MSHKPKFGGVIELINQIILGDYARASGDYNIAFMRLRNCNGKLKSC